MEIISAFLSVYNTLLVPEKTSLKFDMWDLNSNLLDNSNFQPYWPIIKTSWHKAINGLLVCFINHFTDIEIQQGQLYQNLSRSLVFSHIFLYSDLYYTSSWRYFSMCYKPFHRVCWNSIWETPTKSHWEILIMSYIMVHNKAQFK